MRHRADDVALFQNYLYSYLHKFTDFSQVIEKIKFITIKRSGMDRGFRLSLVLCGIMSGDFIVSSYGEQFTKHNVQISIVTALAKPKISADQDCSTGGTPKKLTPSPKNRCQKSCDDLFDTSVLSRGSSMRDLLPVGIVTSVAASPDSNYGRFSGSVSPSTASLDGMDMKPVSDCKAGTPEKLTPSPKPSSPRK
ncbi:MAG: hypothetical protein NTZ68_02055 [Candidatus Dependentiae bacterium]|nr:hypothetical protein [Candidatus Dependentiae bacterium]